ncbi:MAG: hypothetical protein EOR30_32105 [Mesorhizobium sp.]|nr:MAG: hypothetical protein EOR14_33165 [Mesorhizobium sp.]RWI37073.1 MAG: hypothetical protein EOR14_26030 [Mesorhizobium sp.]RWI62624.1 MAG: hypothetical protein EOR17_32070 [Mesorhizobium sp.]RWI81447.1 MAG: hypothetical protein EOR20_32485 [Mesorhizobium sp.]RWJ42394.1 MAG: hypothetical protein EOR30_32105 [Mesorhizobium sp.]
MFLDCRGLRALLYESATVILTRSAADSCLRTWGLKLKGDTCGAPIPMPSHARTSLRIRAMSSTST